MNPYDPPTETTPAESTLQEDAEEGLLGHLTVMAGVAFYLFVGGISIVLVGVAILQRFQ